MEGGKEETGRVGEAAKGRVLPICPHCKNDIIGIEWLETPSNICVFYCPCCHNILGVHGSEFFPVPSGDRADRH